jgi:hypothetical protein
MLGPEEWPSRQQWRTKFGLQVRLLRTFIFNHWPTSEGCCDTAVTRGRTTHAPARALICPPSSRPSSPPTIGKAIQLLILGSGLGSVDDTVPPPQWTMRVVGDGLVALSLSNSRLMQAALALTHPKICSVFEMDEPSAPTTGRCRSAQRCAGCRRRHPELSVCLPGCPAG